MAHYGFSHENVIVSLGMQNETKSERLQLNPVILSFWNGQSRLIAQMNIKIEYGNVIDQIRNIKY